MRFSVRVPGVAELESGDPAEVAIENALAKARAAVARQPAEVIIGCDTLVALDGEIYGKPADEGRRGRRWRRSPGRTHEVLSGLAVLRPAERARPRLERTAVSFRELAERR